MKPITDPKSLRQRDGVEFVEEGEILDEEEFESLRGELEDLDNHVVVGVTNEKGEVLLMNDGHHGWTLTAVPVESGRDWVAAARHGVKELTGVAVEIECPKRVRQIGYRTENDNEDRISVYNVALRASPVAKTTVDIDPDEENTPVLRWFDDVPEGVEGAVADDIRLFVE